jgi:hypothetical protein
MAIAAGGGVSGTIGGLSDVSIAKPTGVCAATGAAIGPGERFVAALFEKPGAALEREDFTAHAWDAGSRPAGTLLAFWRGAMPASAAKAPARLDNAELLELFERLGPGVEGQAAAMRYVLALLLVRRRVLRYAGQHGGALRVTDGTDAPPIEVKDPGLDAGAIAAVADRFGELAGLEPGTTTA